MFEWLESLAIDVEAATAVGWARVPAEHQFLADHFPGLPTLPGSLQIELCAQVAGPLAEELAARRDGRDRWAFIGMVRSATFHARVSLPATLEIQTRATRVEQDSVVMSVLMAFESGVFFFRAELVMMLVDAEPGWDDAIRVYRARIAALKARARP